MIRYVLGGGCFWCLDAVYRRIKGVVSVTSGYAGGHDEQPNYYRVLSGHTGHAEVVEVRFDPDIVPSEIILDLFFLLHDPTTKDRQGADVGPQYRSIMLFADDAQKQQFELAITRAQPNFEAGIVTEIAPLDKFYPAESEHQDYFTKNPAAGYCSMVISPKITKARAKYRTWFNQ